MNLLALVKNVLNAPTPAEQTERARVEGETHRAAHRIAALLDQRDRAQQEIATAEAKRPTLEKEADAIRAKGMDFNVSDANRLLAIEEEIERTADAHPTTTLLGVKRELSTYECTHPALVAAILAERASATTGK